MNFLCGVPGSDLTTTLVSNFLTVSDFSLQMCYATVLDGLQKLKLSCSNGICDSTLSENTVILCEAGTGHLEETQGGFRFIVVNSRT